MSCVAIESLLRADHRTLPLGGFVNHRVHVFIKGCLTLKFSGSWKTVIGSVALKALLEASLPSFAPEIPPSGEIGIVSSGTC